MSFVQIKGPNPFLIPSVVLEIRFRPMYSCTLHERSTRTTLTAKPVSKKHTRNCQHCAMRICACERANWTLGACVGMYVVDKHLLVSSCTSRQNDRLSFVTRIYMRARARAARRRDATTTEKRSLQHTSQSTSKLSIISYIVDLRPSSVAVPNRETRAETDGEKPLKRDELTT